MFGLAACASPLAASQSPRDVTVPVAWVTQDDGRAVPVYALEANSSIRVSDAAIVQCGGGR